MATILWKFNQITGLWDSQRVITVASDEKTWLEVFQKQEPEEIFLVSSRRPTFKKGLTLQKQKRDRRSGRYTYEGQYQRLCVCGHVLGQHLAEAPHGCIQEDERGVIGGAACPCERFRPSRAKMERHETGKNPTVSQQKANRQKPPRRRDYGQGIHVEYSPGNAAYFVMWHHEVLSIHPTWEGADEKARGLVLNKTRDGSDECSVVSSHAAVTLRRTQSGEPPVVEHYRRLSEAIARARRYMKENPPGEHGRITIESHERGRYLSRVFKTSPKNAFEWQWSEK